MGMAMDGDCRCGRGSFQVIPALKTPTYVDLHSQLAVFTF